MRNYDEIGRDFTDQYNDLLYKIENKLNPTPEEQFLLELVYRKDFQCYLEEMITKAYVSQCSPEIFPDMFPI